MKLEIQQQKENPLLSRRELRIRVESDKTLSRKELREKIALDQNVEADRLSVTKITQQAGNHVLCIDARVYDSKEALEQNELTHIAYRNRGEKKKPAPKEKKTKK